MNISDFQKFYNLNKKGIDDEQIYFVTAYVPNTDKFEEDLKTRRK